MWSYHLACFPQSRLSPGKYRGEGLGRARPKSPRTLSLTRRFNGTQHLILYIVPGASIHCTLQWSTQLLQNRIALGYAARPRKFFSEVIQQGLEQWTERRKVQDRHDAENEWMQLEAKRQAFVERAMQPPADDVSILLLSREHRCFSSRG